MLKTLQDLFDRVGAGPQAPEDDRLSVAAAALLYEVAYADAGVAAAEWEALERAVRELFGLTKEQTDTLLRQAEQESKESVGLFAFTSLVNDAFAPADKARLVELMWRVAYADRQLHKYEEHLVRRAADLLYVSHTDFIRAKHRAAMAAAAAQPSRP